VYLILFAIVLFMPSKGSAATKDSLLPAINHLLKYVEESKCTFIRNDKAFDAKEAARHIKTKYESFISDIKTPEDFIDLAASKSMLSGRPYFVRCADSSQLSADWLKRELFNYRNSLHDTSLTK
jgi:hypothetical protein